MHQFEIFCINFKREEYWKFRNILTLFSAGYSLEKITAKIPDRFEAGTNGAINLKLKNRDTGEECETGMLDDSDYDNWYGGTEESFTRSKYKASFGPCRFFSPSRTGELMFNIKNSGSDDLLLESVKLRFKVLDSMFDRSTLNSNSYPTLSFTWNGWHKFNDDNQDIWHSIKQENFSFH